MTIPTAKAERVGSELVRVPWRHGTVVTAKPAPAEPRPKRAELCALKAKQIEQDIARLVAAGKERLEVAASASQLEAVQQKREALDRQVDFQRRRLAWLGSIAEGKDGALRQRMLKLEAQLAPAEMAYLAAGLPERLSGDQRLLDLLGELALLRFALEVR